MYWSFNVIQFYSDFETSDSIVRIAVATQCKYQRMYTKCLTKFFQKIFKIPVQVSQRILQCKGFYNSILKTFIHFQPLLFKSVYGKHLLEYLLLFSLIEIKMNLNKIMKGSLIVNVAMAVEKLVFEAPFTSRKFISIIPLS